MANRSSVRFVVSREHDLRRLDWLLAHHVDGLGRRAAGLLCERGLVRVDGRRARKGLPVGADSVVEADVVEALGHALPAPHVELRILLETPDLVVVDKPAGLPSAALPGRCSETAAGALLARYPEMAEVGFGPRDPGLIHRLDTWTSGVLVAARHPEAFRALRRQLESGGLDKRYLAIVPSGVDGSLSDAGFIASRLVSSPDGSRVRVAEPLRIGTTSSTHSLEEPNLLFSEAADPTRHPGSRDVTERAFRTDYRVLERRGAWALLNVHAPVAYRHQIRAHLAYLGVPLAGDVLYGGNRTHLGRRHALHAHYVAGAAAGGTTFSAEAPLPKDLAELLSE